MRSSQTIHVISAHAEGEVGDLAGDQVLEGMRGGLCVSAGFG